MKLKVTIILGHPRTDSFCGALADAYAEGAAEAGAAVRRVALGSLEFDMNVTGSSPRDQPLESDLASCKEAIEEAGHLVFVYPTWWATMPALIALFIAIVALADRGAAWVASVGVLAAIALLLGPGYTVPPLKLSYRGFGELVVAFTHSHFMVLCGWIFLGGSGWDAFPWLISLPMALAILAAITLAGVPDITADQAAGKRTAAVRLGPRRAAWIALAAVIGAALLVPLLGLVNGTIQELFGGVFPWLGLHGVVLTALIVGYLGSGAECRRIDGVLMAALSYILWFSVAPLLALL